MKLAKSIAIAVFLVACAEALHAQQPVTTSICAILGNPMSFAGKVVKVRATVATGFELSSVVDAGENCNGGMWLHFAPERGEKGQIDDGRDEQLQRQQPVFLKIDDAFKTFQAALGAELYPRTEGSICMACPLYTVSATMIGRVDYAGERGLGFGHLNASRLRFVLVSVSDVSKTENPYDHSQWSSTQIRFPHGTVSGTVFDASGKGVFYGKVEAVPVEGEMPILAQSVLTDDRGLYSLNLKPGQYLLVVNRDSPATTGVPMDITYFPSADERSNAQVVTIADYATFKGLNIRATHSLGVKHIRVHVVWPDGSPVEIANVNISESDKGYAIAGDDEGGVKHTDKDGWVTLIGYVGKSYRLYANIYKKPGYVPYCEDVYAIPADFPDGLTVPMILRRQSETCRGQWDESAKPLPLTK